MSVRTLYKRLLNRYPVALKPFHGLYLNVLHRYRKFRYAPAEALLDNLATSLAGDVCLQVPEFNAQFYLDSRSALFRRLARDGHYEPELTKLCAEYIKPELDVLDVGANVGFHTVYFSGLLSTGRVLAVEPTSGAQARLQKNIKLNKLRDNIILFEGAASDNPGSAEIKVITGREEFSTMGSMSHQAVSGEHYELEVVECQTLDSLVNLHSLTPGFIKLDVEGLEHLVLKGALDTLSRFRPVILAEVSDKLLSENGSSAAEVVNLLESSGYRVCDANAPQNAASLADYGEVLCLPR